MRQVVFIALVAVLSIASVSFGAGPAWAQFPAPQPQQPQQPLQPHQPVQPQPVQPGPAQPTADPRAERIKNDLQQRGYRIHEVYFKAASGNATAFWWVAGPAQYSQPSGGAVLRHAFDVWGSIYAVASQDPPQTGMVGVQAWSKYLIGFEAGVGLYTDLLNRLRSASSQGEKDQAVNDYLGRIRFRVFDTERRQFVDQQDFVNKNFTR